MHKRTLKSLFCILLSAFIVGCGLDGEEISAPVVFDEIGLPGNALGIHALTLSDPESKKSVDFALKITKNNDKYVISMVQDGATIEGDLVPSRIPASKNLYALSINNQKQYVYNKEDATLLGLIKKHALLIARIGDDGIAFIPWNDEKKKYKYEGLSVDVTYRHRSSGPLTANMFDADDVKKHLMKHHAAIEAVPSDGVLFFKWPNGFLSEVANWLRYHRITTYGRLMLWFQGVREEHYLNAENDAIEYVKYAENVLKERAVIDEKIDRQLVSYLKNDEAYIIPVAEDMDKVCKKSSIGRENQPSCYEYMKVLDAKGKKIKQAGYIKNLVKVGAPQLEQGSTARAYTYRTPDRTEISGKNIYTYPGETVTSYTSDVDRYAFLHIPVVNDSCSAVTVNAAALFIYNPFNPNDNQGAVASFFGNIYKAIISSVDDNFGKRRASGRISLEPSSVGTLTIELDSSGFFSNGIRMREAKVEEITYDMKNPGCIEDEAARFEMASSNVRTALMNPWRADFPKSIAEQREGAAK